MKTHPKRFDDVKGFDDARRFDALSPRAAVCVAALVWCALASGCLSQGTPAPLGDANAKPETSAASPTPAQAAEAAPSPAAESPLPRPEGFVNDFAEVIDDVTQASLESKLTVLKARSKIEFAVVTIETTGDRDIFDYSLAVARGWGVGPAAGEGGGLLLMFAVKDRKWRLQVSRGLEADLPDDVAGELGGVMTPSLSAGNFGEAATKYADAVIERLAARRGFSMKSDELIIRGVPAEGSKTNATPEPTPSGKGRGQ